jgi:hypothetical protein
MTQATTADIADATPIREPSPARAPWPGLSADSAVPVKASTGRPHSRPSSWDQKVIASGDVRRAAGPAKMLENPHPTAASTARATLTLGTMMD